MERKRTGFDKVAWRTFDVEVMTTVDLSDIICLCVCVWREYV